MQLAERERRRVAVLGVGGLGAQLVGLLDADGWEVLAVDLRTGFSAELPGQVHSALADVRDADELTGLFQSFRPDVVVNSAAVSADTARRTPSLAVDVNVLGAAMAARAAVRADAGLLVLASCATVYGTRLAGGPDESVLPAPADLHAGTKLAAESISAAMARQAGMAHLVVRPAAMYGERERTPGTLGWALWRAARDASTQRSAGIPAPATGELEMVHVSDAAHAIRLLIRAAGVSRPGRNGQTGQAGRAGRAAPAGGGLPPVVNVGAGRTWSAGELVDAAREAFPDTRWAQQPWEDPGVHRPLDLRLLRELVDFRPAISLVSGLRELGDGLGDGPVAQRKSSTNS